MERSDAEFLELCADWAELRRLEVLCSRTQMGTWQATVMIRDSSGIFFTAPVLAAHDRRKGDTVEDRRGRVYGSLSRAVAAARSRRVEMITGCKPAAAKQR